MPRTKPRWPGLSPLVSTVDKYRTPTRDGKSAAKAKVRWRELIDRVQNSKFPNSWPRDAATLLIVDRSGGEPRLLMGKRHMSLKFMPGKFVFPGGRVEPYDYLASIGCGVDASILAKLMRDVRRLPHRQRALALLHAALRETQEETGVVIGPGFRRPDSGPEHRPDFSSFTFLARAITPPRVNRRFDTRFFVVPAEQISARGPITDGEFTAVEWFSLDEARQQDLPGITRMVLDDLEERLVAGTLSDPDAAVPFYFMRGACFHRKLI
jgi:8-oxo-dGTP pyrophosphatase MutT (NUDIX family)